MTDDIYQVALASLVRHLKEAGVTSRVEDGEIQVGSHRLGLSVNFEDFVPQGGELIAPVDIQLHLDGDEGDRFRVGTLGVGLTPSEAIASAVEEWFLLAAAPVLAALGAELTPRRPPSHPPRLAGWRFYPGRMSVRGRVPPALAPTGPFYKILLATLHKFVSDWEDAGPHTLRSIYILATCSPNGEREIQAAVDGFVSEPLHAVLQDMAWPRANDTYLYKQLFVLAGAE